MDAVWGEEGNAAGVNSEGVLTSRIRSFKTASILRNTLFVESGSSILQMGESMAFGRQCLGYIGDIPSGQEPSKRTMRLRKIFSRTLRALSRCRGCR